MKYTAVICECERYSGVPQITVASFEASDNMEAKMITWKHTYEYADEQEVPESEEEMDEWLEEQDVSDVAIVSIRKEGEEIFSLGMGPEIYFEKW